MRLLQLLLTPKDAALVVARWLWLRSSSFLVQIYQFGQRDNFVILLLLPFIALEASAVWGACAPALPARCWWVLTALAGLHAIGCALPRS